MHTKGRLRAALLVRGHHHHQTLRETAQVMHDTRDAAATGTWDKESIKLHPLWDLQVQLERGMQHEGAEIARDAALLAAKKQKATRLQPVRNMLTEWVPLVADALVQWKHSWVRKTGPRPIELHVLGETDPYVAAMVGLRAVLDGMMGVPTGHGSGHRLPGILSVCQDIGRTIEHEHKVALWAKHHPKLFTAAQRRLGNEGATSTHRAIVNVLEFNKHMDDGVFAFGWVPWGRDLQQSTGKTVVDAILRTTQWFDLAPDPFHIPKAHHAGLMARYVIMPKPELLEHVQGALEHSALSRPIYMPSVVPPRRWDSTRKGGYWTPFVRTTRLIRFHTIQEDQREAAADEYDALDMPMVYDAVHFLQEVPWRINLRVFEIATELVRRDERLAGLPAFAARDTPVPPWVGKFVGERGRGRVTGLDTDDPREKRRVQDWQKRHPEETAAWKKSVGATIRDNLKAHAKANSPKRTMRIAGDLIDQTFYFPHMLDFRGRMYPIPVGLQPQGDDLARGLLTFAEAKPLGPSGLRWLAIHLASCFGEDKTPFDDRVKWVSDRQEVWEAVAIDPLGELPSWHKADKPFQALAAIIEYVQAWYHPGDPSEYECSLPIAVDGTCNGIQHLSAMTRDKLAASYVNMVPADRPQDIYKFVVDQLQKHVQAEEGQEWRKDRPLATYWMDLLGREPGSWSRKMGKRPVMVVPYGGTLDAFFGYVREYLADTYPEWRDKRPAYDSPERKLQTDALVYLVKHMWDQVHQTVSGATTVMEWIQQCSKLASKGNQPVYWKLPTGFVVRHFYGKVDYKRVKLKLDGVEIKLQKAVITEHLDATRQGRGIAPNFVHSHDAAAMTMCIDRLQKDGITAFTAVHDAFGTHACDMDLLAVRLREAFVELHETDVLGQFRAQCMMVYAQYLEGAEGIDLDVALELADEAMPRVPAMGDLDIREVLHSDYFFA